MISLSSLAQQRLSLWQRHYQERKVFYSAETGRRHVLGRKHRQERNDLHVSLLKSRQMAALLFQQVSEIMEFRVINRDRWWCLLNRQHQEKADFEAALRLTD